MSRDDWFRRSTWSAEDAAEFHERLRRSRTSFHKAQYLRVQAVHLQKVGTPRLLRAALELLDELLSNYPDASQLSSAYHQRAECLIGLGDEDGAVRAFRDAFAARRAYPGMGNNAHLDFAELAVLRDRSDLYPEVVQALAEFGGNDPWPVNRFRMATALALISEHTGDRESAGQYAQAALTAAGAIESPFRYHKELGLVRDPEPAVMARLRALAGETDAGRDDGAAPLRRWLRALRRR